MQSIWWREKWKFSALTLLYVSCFSSRLLRSRSDHIRYCSSSSIWITSPLSVFQLLIFLSLHVVFHYAWFNIWPLRLPACFFFVLILRIYHSAFPPNLSIIDILEVSYQTACAILKQPLSGSFQISFWTFTLSSYCIWVPVQGLHRFWELLL